MLQVYNKQKSIIHELNSVKIDKDIEFHITCDELLDVYQDSQSVCLFYGFLDQDIKLEKSAAKFINETITEKPHENLLELYGSFLILYYNKDTQSLWLANDSMGDCLASYTFEDDKYKLADFAECLLHKGNNEINETRIQHYFALTQPLESVSFFKKIQLQKPGHIIEFKQTQFFTNQYYYPPTTINFKKQSIDSLSKKYNKLLQQAIKLQTQGQERIAVLMSGGLDSTLVVANSIEAGKDVNSYSYVFPKTPESNETMWIETMRKLNHHMFTFAGEAYWSLKSPWFISINSPFSNPYRHLKDVVSSQVKHKNIKFLLTGVYADHAYTGYIYWLVDRFKRNPLKALSQLFTVFRKKGLKTALGQISPKKWSNKDICKAPWLTQVVSKNIQESLKKRNKTSIAHKQKHNLVFGINSSQCAHFENEYSFKNNIFLRNPYRDRRVVEFVSTLPAYVLGTIFNRKQFARNSGKDLLPETILRRNKISTMQPLMLKGLLDEEFEKVRGLLLAKDTIWQKYVQKDLIQKVLDNPKAIHKSSDYLVLWLCVGFELWRKRLKSV